MAAADERARIARELHDVVAHSVSVMVVQAGAARRVLDSSPRRASEALGIVEQTGREALTEMRRLLGVLRAQDEGAALAPQPGMDSLGELVERARGAGLPVELELLGEPRPLPASVDLSAYRIVQEALTNTLKHAGPAAARVTIRFGEEQVEVKVTDDGRGARRSDGAGQGHGLVGMRQRAAVLGGDLHTGGGSGGGYEVRARLPLAAES